MGKYSLIAQESYLKLKLKGYSNDNIAKHLGISRPFLDKCRTRPSLFTVGHLEIMLEILSAPTVIKEEEK